MVKQDYGLTDDDILFGDDKLINQYISLKKISPYIENEHAIRVSKSRLPAIQNNAKLNRVTISPHSNRNASRRK